MDDALLHGLHAATAGLVATRPAVEAGAPWPLATTIDTSDEARWGPPEVLAHVAEMASYWLGEMERVLAGAPEPVPFGRVATDPIRIAVLERDRSLPPRELYDRTMSSLERMEKRLQELTSEQLARRGLHPRLGEMTVAQMAERFVVSHLAEHDVQLESLLGGSSTGS
jgi:DinB superfamily